MVSPWKGFWLRFMTHRTRKNHPCVRKFSSIPIVDFRVMSQKSVYNRVWLGSKQAVAPRPTGIAIPLGWSLAQSYWISDYLGWKVTILKMIW